MSRLLRSDLLQSLLDLFAEPAYLEIGVNQGETFKVLRAGKKVAVDPKFLFDTHESNQNDITSVFHEVTSDVFFESLSEDARDFDVVYLDGLHTFEQTLRDLLNVMIITNRHSIIVIDDVVPKSFAASLPRLEDVYKLREHTQDKDMSWMGDVYKLVYFIESFLPMYTYATVTDNHGQLVMWRSARAPVERTVQDITQANYLDTVLDRAFYKFKPFAEILSDIRQSRSAS